MTARSWLGAARRGVLTSLQRRTAPLATQEPIVSFTFDDFPRSAYLVGGSVLENFGMRGTYYAAFGLMNTANELGELFSPDDLHALLDKGHELATHTFSHISCRSVSCSEFRSDVEQGKRAIAELAGVDTANFAYPFGHVTLRTKKALALCLASARSVIPGLNGPEIDLNMLRANRLYGDMDISDAVKDLIQKNVEQKGWLIFYTHDVRSNPSEYGCTPELLEFAVSAAARSGSRILTVQAALAEIGVGTSEERHLSFSAGD
jgi:peptidoglycan/xylan/chitin deacetylase (PgdA/CDA1 family)